MIFKLSKGNVKQTLRSMTESFRRPSPADAIHIIKVNSEEPLRSMTESFRRLLPAGASQTFKGNG